MALHLLKRRGSLGRFSSFSDFDFVANIYILLVFIASLLIAFSGSVLILMHMLFDSHFVFVCVCVPTSMIVQCLFITNVLPPL